MITRYAAGMSAELYRLSKDIGVVVSLPCAIQLHVLFVVSLSDFATFLRFPSRALLRLLLLMFFSWFRHLAMVFLVDTRIWPIRLFKQLLHKMQRFLYKRHDFKAMVAKLNWMNLLWCNCSAFFMSVPFIKITSTVFFSFNLFLLISVSLLTCVRTGHPPPSLDTTRPNLRYGGARFNLMYN
jgi:hypothetical protein